MWVKYYFIMLVITSRIPLRQYHNEPTWQCTTTHNLDVVFCPFVSDALRRHQSSPSFPPHNSNLWILNADHGNDTQNRDHKISCWTTQIIPLTEWFESNKRFNVYEHNGLYLKYSIHDWLLYTKHFYVMHVKCDRNAVSDVCV